MEWKKITSMEYGKIIFHSIPYHALAAALETAIVTDEDSSELSDSVELTEVEFVVWLKTSGDKVFGVSEVVGIIGVRSMQPTLDISLHIPSRS